MKVETIFDIQCEHGEGPVWDPVEGKLYWVDLLKGDYLKADLDTAAVARFNIGQPLGVLALLEKGGLIVALRDGLAFWDENQKKLEFISCPEKENPSTRFNDGKEQPFAGRVLMVQTDVAGVPGPRFKG